MLRQVYITQNKKIIYKKEFGKALNETNIDTVFSTILTEASKVHAENIYSNDFFKYRVTYLSLPNLQILIVFVADLSDEIGDVEKEITKCKKEFLGLFEPFLEGGMELDDDSFDLFNPVIDSIHKSMRPKISLVGFSGVGKTTITQLIKAEDIPTEHVPTISGDIGTIKIGNLHFNLWDFAGQEQFSYLWGNFIEGSDVVLIITDSTVENVDKSRFFIELIKEQAAYTHAAVIGNKQDLPDAIPVSDIERILGKKTYSMIATDPENRSKMIQIIADVLEIAGEISPLLKPLIERDTKMKEAEKAIEIGDMAQAANLFEEIAELSLELGDDRLHQNFLEKGFKIRDMVEKTANSPPVSTPITTQPSFMKNDENIPPISTLITTQPSFMNDEITPPISNPTSAQISSTEEHTIIPPEKNIIIDKTPPSTEADSDINEIIKQLKVKKAHINQKIFDLEMENISGDVDDETCREKTNKLESLRAKIEEQIKELSE